MKKKLEIIIIFMLISPLLYGKFGKAIITYQPQYENENIFFPHDHFVGKNDKFHDTTLSLKIFNNKINIINKFNNGFFGHNIKITVANDLTIEDVKYSEWTDVIDGSESNFEVEKIILTFNSNPFKNKNVVGHFILQLKNDYKAGEFLKTQGYFDTVIYNIFYGKFKEYSTEEKQKGNEWVNENSLIKMGIKDSSGIYIYKDETAYFKFSMDSIKKFIKKFEIKNSVTGENFKDGFIFNFIVNEHGIIEKESIKLSNIVKADSLIIGLKENEYFINNWVPAYYKKKPVKSVKDLYINLKK